MAEANPEVSGQKLWYVQKKGRIMGPFPSGSLRRFVLLGRVRVDDQVSEDKKSWKMVSSVPEVVPREVRKALQEGRLAELIPARMREDERTGNERRSGEDDKRYAGRRKGERRSDEEEALVRHRKQRQNILELREKRQHSMLSIIVIGALVVFAVVGGFFLGKPDPIADPDCTAAPAPAVNWRNCILDQIVHESANLEGAVLSSAILRDSRLSGVRLLDGDLKYADFSGADLSYANLVNAQLKGASLRNSDLSYADLSQADLSYSDLSGANLGGAKLDNAVLDQAIWVDGKTCIAGSVGQCKQLAE